MGKLKVGFGKVNITPECPMPLGGYGSEKTRIHDRVLNEIYISAVAITDSQDNTLLLATIDISLPRGNIYENIAKGVEEEFGITADYFHLSSTHTHSSVAIGVKSEAMEKYREDLVNKGIKACRIALNDRKEAELYVGETKTERLNFIRHYYRADGSVTTDNYNTGDIKSPIVKHITEPDETLRLIKFVRTNEDGSEARDIAIINYQVHNHMTGSGKKLDLAADCTGAICSYLESYHNCHAAYFQGCAGNLNEKSRIKTENRTENYLEYARLFTEYVNAIYDNENLKKINGDKISVLRERFNIKINHAEEDKLEAAFKLQEFRGKHGVNDECRAYAKELGFHSPYHASGIANRSSEPEEYFVYLNAYRIGDMGWTSAPFEVFDQTGVDIRAASPFEFTVTQGYTDGANSYLPTENAFEYGCYEVDITRNAKGSAERVRDKLIEMLNRLK